jgi:hypothetical protein
VLLADLIWTSLKIEQYEEGEAEHTRILELDSIEEVRINATPSVSSIPPRSKTPLQQKY